MCERGVLQREKDNILFLSDGVLHQGRESEGRARERRTGGWVRCMQKQLALRPPSRELRCAYTDACGVYGVLSRWVCAA